DPGTYGSGAATCGATSSPSTSTRSARPGSAAAADRLDELVDGDGGQGERLDGAPRPERDGDAGDHVDVGRFEDGEEVVLPQEGVLGDDAGAHALNLGVDL